MTQPWYPFYWADYSAKTMHLTMPQHGAFMLFLRWIYTTERPIPHKHRYSIARAMLEHEQSDADFVLEEFFVRAGDEWTSKRAESVICETKKRHENRVNAGKKGGKSKFQNASNARAMLEQCPSDDLLTTTTTTLVDTNVSPKTSSKVPKPIKPPPATTDADFESFWSGWRPYDMDKGSKANARKAYDRARKETDHETIVRKRDQYLDDCHRNSRRTTHASTWLNPTGRRGWADDYTATSAPTFGRRSNGYSLEAAYQQALADQTRRPERDQERLKALGLD